MPRNNTTVRAVVGGQVTKLTMNEVNNCVAFRFYQNQLRALAGVRIEWGGLPDNIDELFVGQKLLSTDMCYFKDEIIGKEYILPATVDGNLDVQGIPQEWRVNGSNGYTRKCSNEDSVLIRCTPCVVDGELMTPWQIIDYYADKLAEVDRTITVNLKRQKLPWILAGDDTQEKSINKFFEDIDNNVPFIRVQKEWQDLVKVLNTQAPLVVPQLYDYKKSLWQEALGYLGITNTSIEKRERLTTSEVEANNDGTVMMRYLILTPYQIAVKKINKMFKRNITVNFRDNVGASLDGTSEIEGETNGKEQENED